MGMRPAVGTTTTIHIQVERNQMLDDNLLFNKINGVHILHFVVMPYQTSLCSQSPLAPELHT